MSENKKTIDISDAEFDVLDVIWDKFPATSSDIITRLNKRKTWHEKTVKTLLGRLVKKSVLGYEKQQRRYLYSPLIARDDYTKKQTSHFIGRLFNGKIAPLVAGFANHNALSEQDINELKTIIKQWEADRD